MKWSNWKPGVGLRAWERAKSGLICPCCGYVTTAPDVHFLSALCIVRFEGQQRAAAGIVQTLHPHVLMMAGCAVDEAVVGAQNASTGRSTVEHEMWDVGWVATAADDALAYRSTFRELRVDWPPPPPLLRAAIVRRELAAPGFLDGLEAAARLGGPTPDNVAMWRELVEEVHAADRLDGPTLHRIKDAHRVEDQRKVDYVLCRMRAGQGFPSSFWGPYISDRIRVRIFRAMLAEPDVYHQVIVDELEGSSYAKRLLEEAAQADPDEAGVNHAARASALARSAKRKHRVRR